MGFRFGRSIRLGKFARLNLNKKGLGASLGIKGFRFGVGPRGARVTAGVPGTGLSYTTRVGTGQPVAATGKRVGLGRGCGCLLACVLAVPALAIVGRIAKESSVGALVTVALCIFGLFWWQSHRSNAARDRVLAEEQAANEARWNSLCQRFGPDGAHRIWTQTLWVGAPSDAVSAMFGPPIDVDERVMKTRRTLTLKYFPKGADRYGLRVFVEDGVVAGWEDKR